MDFGRRGMAMFLVADHWNDVCSIIGLPRFALSMKEKERAEKSKSSAKRVNKRNLTGHGGKSICLFVIMRYWKM